LLIDPHDHPPRWFQYDIPDNAALLVVISIIGISILVSVIAARRGKAGRDRWKQIRLARHEISLDIGAAAAAARGPTGVRAENITAVGAMAW